MKKKWISLMALMLCAVLLLPTTVMAREVTPEDFLAMTDDAQEQYLNNTGMSYEEAAGWSTDGGGSLMDDGFVQCERCGGWYMNGSEFRNHICTGSSSAKPSSSWTSDNDYYDALVKGLHSDTVTAMGTLYVNTANGKSLNLRTRPSTKGSIQATIPNGASVTLFWYENSSWAYVAYRGYYGFCMTRHLSENITPAPTPSSDNDTNLTNMFKGFRNVNYNVAVKPSNPSGFVNLRWAPTKAAPVQCIYYADTILKVIATNGTWSQVYNEITGVSGFMMNAYLNKLLY